MSNFSYYWHDYETFGANPRRDRPSQFAGLRTDADFNIIGEPLTLYCRPTDDYVPHPEACLLTGITPQQAEAEGIPEPQFIARIINELSRPGTCGIGYNSLRFDDEVTRHTAWRNFFDPYAREWRNGCSRWDLIDVVRMTYALRPEGIEWPTRSDGKPSFRLEELTAANGLTHTHAHDALADVHATVALARLIKTHQPRLFDWAFNNRTKAACRNMLGLAERAMVLHVSSRFPAELGCLSPIVPLCAHPTNQNAILAYDLRHDPEELSDLTAEDIHERIFTPRADLPDDVDRIAIKTVHINRSPVLAPVNTLKPEQCQRIQLDLDRCRQFRLDILAMLNDLTPKLEWVFSRAYADSSRDADTALYDGFIEDGDRTTCQRVINATVDDLAIDQFPFRDARLSELLFRYRARHFPESLSEDERNHWQAWRQRRLEHAPDGGLSLSEYFEIIQQMSASESDEGRLKILAALNQWGQHLGTA